MTQTDDAETLRQVGKYTDPMMDGPVIQEAGAQALAAGFTVRHLMETVRSLAPVTHVLVMGYYQPLYRYGLRRTAEELAEAGAAGVILPDLNIDEAGPWLAEACRVGLHTVFVIAPTASDERLRRIAGGRGRHALRPGHCRGHRHDRNLERLAAVLRPPAADTDQPAGWRRDRRLPA
ncbi:tryptophan synthase subunit alpha [Streptomyces nodosus]|uniref:tryptophan synthase subunit alpha n=1 Tax=Streptomyces nodosus TaxID=40318 RepID=UPI003454CD75